MYAPGRSVRAPNNYDPARTAAPNGDDSKRRPVMNSVWGFLLALFLALAGEYLAGVIAPALGLQKGAISGIMMAILLGILVNNLFRLPEVLRPGIRFSVVRILRLGIVLLGIRLSIVETGAIGLKSLPIIVGTVLAALAIVTWVSRRVGLTDRLGTLIAVGTSICGATAIVAMSPTIGARDDETSYAVACITLFGVVAMLAYPFAAHWMFAGDGFRSGMFLGTAVHETAQVAGAGLVYQQYFDDPRALDVATVTKLVRNMSMLLVIPIMAVFYHRRSSEGGAAPKWYTMVPIFIVGFAAMSLLRTLGDVGDRPFGMLEPEQWKSIVGIVKQLATYCLAIAMAAVGLGTSIKGLRAIGLKPLGVGLFSALLVGVVSYTLVMLLY
jgi:uncharacterized integral membrane protein (TIGR00698 family)